MVANSFTSPHPLISPKRIVILNTSSQRLRGIRGVCRWRICNRGITELHLSCILCCKFDTYRVRKGSKLFGNGGIKEHVVHSCAQCKDPSHRKQDLRNDVPGVHDTPSWPDDFPLTGLRSFFCQHGKSQRYRDRSTWKKKHHSYGSTTRRTLIKNSWISTHHFYVKYVSGRALGVIGKGRLHTD